MKDLKNSKSNSFKVISTPQQEAGPGALDLERRRVPRLNLGTEQFKLNATGRLFSVIDLSQTGLALWASDPVELVEFVVGMRLAGVLNLGQIKFPVEIHVRNHSKNRIGAEFVSPSHEIGLAIHQSFDPVALGKSLKPIPAMERGELWYFGASGTHLSLRRLNDGQFDHLSLCFGDSLVQWDSEQGLQSGNLIQSESPGELRGIFRLDTLFFKRDSSMDKEKLERARQVLMHSHLPNEIKGWGVRQFSR